MLPPKELREDVNAAIPLHLIAAFLTLLTFIVLFTFAIIDVVEDTVLVANIIAFLRVFLLSVRVTSARATEKSVLLLFLDVFERAYLSLSLFVSLFCVRVFISDMFFVRKIVNKRV